MIDFLYANGCSWTAGNGIEQDPKFQHLAVSERWAKLSELSWPKVLSDKFQVNCANQALGAASNKRMVRTTVDFLQNYTGDYEKLLVILGWTTVDRNEIYIEENNKGCWVMFNSTQTVSDNGMHVLNGFSKDFISQIDDWQKNYLIDIYSSYERYHEFFKELYLMKNLLENLKVKYLFFNSLRWRNYGFFWTRTPKFDPEKEFRAQIQNLTCDNLINLYDDNNNVMELFCKNNNVPMAKDHHTMVEGHKMYAEHLYNHIIKLYPNIK